MYYEYASEACTVFCICIYDGASNFHSSFKYIPIEVALKYSTHLYCHCFYVVTVVTVASLFASFPLKQIHFGLFIIKTHSHTLTNTLHTLLLTHLPINLPHLRVLMHTRTHTFIHFE